VTAVVAIQKIHRLGVAVLLQSGERSFDADLACAIPRAQAEALMLGMTDPAAIRMVKEVIAFAYSRPAGTPIETLRSDLREQCIAKKIFVQ
jgi:hypothetical protein